MSMWKAGVWKPGVWRASVWGCGVPTVIAFSIRRLFVVNAEQRPYFVMGES